jgi:hypothetical protein
VLAVDVHRSATRWNNARNDGGLRRLIASALRARPRFAATRAFALSRESLSLPNGGRESNQREGHPGAAHSGPPALRVRARCSLVYDCTSLYKRRQADILSASLRAFRDHRSPPLRGPNIKRSALQRAEARSRALHLRGAESCRAGVSPAFLMLRNRPDGTRHACPTVPLGANG